MTVRVLPPSSYKHPYPEALWRQKEMEAARKEKEARRARRAAKASGVVVRARSLELHSTMRRHLTSPALLQPAALPTPVANTPVAFLFPGQGSQAVGMLGSCKDLPAVRTMLATAQRVLGYDLLDMCLNGPKSSLDDTVNSQPALFVAGLAAVEKLRAENPSLVESASACAGLSLGEYCALVFSGALSFDDGLKVVRVRAQSMAAAAKQGQHGMLSVVGVADAELEAICAKVVKSGAPGCVGSDADVPSACISCSLTTPLCLPTRTVCCVANYLFPQGRVVSGDKSALEEVQKAAAASGALKVQVSMQRCAAAK